MAGNLRLGDLTLRSRLLLAPLERVSYVGFRSLCARLGAGLTFTEMIRAKSITNGTDVISMIDTIDPETPTGIQLQAINAKELKTCLEHMEREILSGEKPHWRNIVAIDLNLGCPKPAAVRYNMGPAMLRLPRRVEEIFRTLRNFRDTTQLTNIKAVGAKIRLGMTEREHRVDKVYLPVLQAANAHLDFLTVHPRHGALPVYEQQPDLEAVSEICALSSPSLTVIGNADVRSPSTMEAMMDTGCHGVMIARGAIHTPWVFRHLLDRSASDWPSLEELDAAEAEALEWEAKWRQANGGRMKRKYITFRERNFERIRHYVRTGETIYTGVRQTRDQKRAYLQQQAERN